MTALLVTLVALAAGSGCAVPGAALATPGIASFSTSVSNTDAGSHADVGADISLNAVSGGTFDGQPDGLVRSIGLALPPGVVGDPNAEPQCSQAVVGAAVQGIVTGGGNRLLAACPAATQVGTAEIYIGNLTQPYDAAILNVETKGDEAGRLVLAGPNLPAIYASITARTDGDFGLNSQSLEVDALENLRRLTLTLWGVPGAHDRGGQFCTAGLCAVYNTAIPPDPPEARTPFMSNPTVCDAPKVTGLTVTFYGNPTQYTASSAQPTPTNCQNVGFDPTLSVAPTSTKADDAAGLDVNLEVPQNDDPIGIASSELRRAEVTLPAGVSVNPGAADALVGCTDTEFGFGSIDAARCPDASKVGTVKLDVPLLPGPLTGSIYLGTQLSSDPQSGRMFRLFQYVTGYGLTIKIPGYAKADPTTGRLTAVFGDLKTLYGAVPDGMLDGLPQVPFSAFELHFRGGSRGLLAMPETGGTKTTQSVLTPWSGNPDATPTSSFDVSADGAGAPVSDPLPFAPTLSAGVVDPTAGGSSPFVLTFARQAGEQNLASIDAALPAGLVGDVGSVPLCPEDLASAGTCDESSRIGSTIVSAGAGDTPLFVPQAGKAPTAVYLTSPYKGAPFGLSIIVPAQAGPFDLGTVVVRAALSVDQHDAHITVKSDPLPTIVDGVPLRVRTVHVNIDRAGFMRNPTNCGPLAVNATIRGTGGGSSDVSTALQMSGCAALPFNPAFAASTRGKLAFKHGASFKVHIAVPAGDANIRSVATTLPKELPSRLIPTINNACLYDVFQADYHACPADSFVGTVTAVTPVLDQPLKGPVYIVSPPGDVPRLEIVLLGQGKAAGVRVDLEGDVIVDSGGGRSKVTFATVPDVPVTSFDLDLPSGPHSILDAPSKDLCQGPITMGLSVIGQNGKRSDSNPTIKVTDCPRIPKVQVVSAKPTSTGVKLRVKAPAEGRLVVSGASVTTLGRTVNRKLTYSVNMKLTHKAKQNLAKKGKLRTRLAVYFKPVNAKKASTVKTKTLTVKKANAKKHTTKKGKAKSRFFASW